MAKTSAIFKGSFTKLLTNLGLKLESGQRLEFESTGEVTTEDTSAAATNSNNMTIQTGDALGAASDAGSITLKSGASDGQSGTVSVESGDSISDNTGNVTIQSGNAGADSGNIIIGSGTPSGSNNDSGDVVLETGNATGTGAESGGVFVSSGNSSGTNGDTGLVQMGTGAAERDSGAIEIKTGAATSGDSGNIELATGTASSGTRGKVVLRGTETPEVGSVLYSEGTSGQLDWRTDKENTTNYMSEVFVNRANQTGAEDLWTTTAEVTVSRETGANNIDSIASFGITTTASATTAHYAQSPTFTMSEVDLGLLNGLSFFVKSDSNYSNGDFEVVIIKDPSGAATEIVPSITEVTANNSGVAKFQASWVPDTAETEYAVRFKVATASTVFAIYFSQIDVGAGQVLTGAVVGPWESFSADGSWTSPTTATYSGFYRRVGESAEILIDVAVQTDVSASGDAGVNLTYDISAIGSVDTTKISGASNTVLGVSNIRDDNAAAGRQTCNVIYLGGDIGPAGISDSTSTFVDDTAPIGFVSGDIISSRFTVPILEWAGQGTVNMLVEDNLSEFALSDTEASNLTVNVDPHELWYRRVGDCLEVNGAIEFTGTNTEGIIEPQIPAGLTIDTAKLPSAVDGPEDELCVGNWAWRTGSSRFGGPVVLQRSDSRLFLDTPDSTGGMSGGADTSGTPVPVAPADGTLVSWSFRVPIVEYGGAQPSLVGFAEATADNVGLVKAERGTFDAEFDTGIFTALSAAARTITVAYSRVDEQVVLNFESISATPSAAALAGAAAGTIPTSLLPPSLGSGGILQMVARIKENGAQNTDVGLVYLRTDGRIQIFKDGTAASNWGTGGEAGWGSFTISYSTRDVV